MYAGLIDFLVHKNPNSDSYSSQLRHIGDYDSAFFPTPTEIAKLSTPTPLHSSVQRGYSRSDISSKCSLHDSLLCKISHCFDPLDIICFTTDIFSHRKAEDYASTRKGHRTASGRLSYFTLQCGWHASAKCCVATSVCI